MKKKYELTEETIEVNGRILHRIKAVRDFGCVKAGYLGGFIQEENLSQEGNAWVYCNAKVYGDAKVYDNAEVYGNAKVYGNAEVFDNAEVCGNAKVYGDTRVYGCLLYTSDAADE